MPDFLEEDIIPLDEIPEQEETDDDDMYDGELDYDPVEYGEDAE